MRKFCYLDDEVLGLLELQKDAIFYNIPKDKIKYYISESYNIGKNEATQLKGKNLEDILKENNVEVIIKDSTKDKPLELRGEIIFDTNEKKIIIYKDSMEELYYSLRDAGVSITKEVVYNIHLAHEFYHFLEYKNHKTTNELLDKVETINFLWFKRKSTILRTRELAAHSFCKEFLNLKFHPQLMDYIYLIKNKYINECEFRENIDSLKNNFLKGIKI